MRRRARGVAGLLAAGFLLGACGGGADGGSDAAGGAEAVGATADAVLGVLEPGVDVADEPEEPAAAEFRAGEDGESLAVSDVVRTDPSGFAEVAWFEGALARVDADSKYTLVEFDATPGQAVVVTELDVGRIWNRLDDGVASTYEVRTDVGTAAVRGTAFWVACTPDGACTFAVLEGTVVVEAADGSQVELAAGEQVTIGADGTPQGVIATDPADEWVVRNDPLDSARGFASLGAATDEQAAPDVRSTGDLDCPFTAPPDGWIEEAKSIVGEFRDRVCRFVLPGAEAEELATVEFLGLNSADGREAILAEARANYEEFREFMTGEPCADGSREVFAPIDEAIGEGSLFGYWWHVIRGPLPESSASIETCSLGNGAFRYVVIRDDIAFALRIEAASMNAGVMFDVCSDEMNQSGAYADCVFAEHERLDREARALAAELLGG